MLLPAHPHALGVGVHRAAAVGRAAAAAVRGGGGGGQALRGMRVEGRGQQGKGTCMHSTRNPRPTHLLLKLVVVGQLLAGQDVAQRKDADADLRGNNQASEALGRPPPPRPPPRPPPPTTTHPPTCTLPTSPLAASCHFWVSQFGLQLELSRRARLPLERASIMSPGAISIM